MRSGLKAERTYHSTPLLEEEGELPASSKNSKRPVSFGPQALQAANSCSQLTLAVWKLNTSIRMAQSDMISAPTGARPVAEPKRTALLPEAFWRLATVNTGF